MRDCTAVKPNGMNKVKEVYSLVFLKFDKNEMGGACSMYGGWENCIQGFGGENCEKENTLKTQA
jgi:hypothetical protein